VRRALRILALSLLVACSREGGQVAMGPGSETSGVSARVVDQNGAAVAGVSVRMVALDDAWQSRVASASGSVLDRKTTDAQGWVRFGNVSDARVALELEDSVRTARGEIDLSQGRTAELRMADGGSQRLSAHVSGETVQEVVLAGTAYAARQAVDGAWVFQGLPEGDFAVVAMTDSGMALLGRVALAAGGALDTVLGADVDSVLLEDFAFDPVRNRYGWLLGAGWWYTTTDLIYGDSSTVTPDDPARMRISCPYGNCIAATFKMDPESDERFAVVGMDVDHPWNEEAPASSVADLSAVEAIRFPVSGQGNIQFQIHFRDPDGTSSTCRQSLVLASTWKVQEVPLASMKCDAAVVAGRRAVGMTWLATEDAQLNLGPVTLAGAGPRQVFAKLRKGGVP